MTTHQEIKTAPGMFWCLPHGEEMPVEDRSPDPRYCNDCWAVIQGESASPRPTPKAYSSLSAAKPTLVIKEEVQLPLVKGVTPKPSTKTVIKRAIVDAIISGNKKGTRTIAEDLKSHGINISHMKVSRMRADMIERGELAHA